MVGDIIHRDRQTFILTRRSNEVPGSSQRMLENSRKLNVDCVVRCTSVSNHMKS